MGAGTAAAPHPLLDNLPWSEDTEVARIQEMDLGLMPLDDTPWSRGKCGYKLIQYMGCGLPVIASPVGVNREIVEHGVNGFLADTEAEWHAALAALLADRDLRARMGAAGRKRVEEHYSLQVWGGRVHDRVVAVRLMNVQAQLGLAIGGPVLLLLIGLAPWVITLLYSADFEPAVTLLQWQTLGNVFKLASWAMSYSIVAAARARTFFFMELSFNIVFLTMVLILLPRVGLEVTAYAFALGYLAYLATAYILARRIHGFQWEALSFGLLVLHTGLAVALLSLALTAPHAAAFASPLLACATGVFGLRIVLIKVGPHGRLVIRLSRLYAAIGWPIRSEK